MHAVINKNLISRMLSQALSNPVDVGELSAVGGGSISRTYKLQSSAGMFFLKLNEAENAVEMFQTEANGLNILRDKSAFTIPRVISLDSEDGTAYLLMDLIVSANRSSNYWEDLAVKLAGLHRQTSAKFGLSENNFIGSLPQQNNFADDWSSFFIDKRILPMVNMAVNNGLVTNAFVADIEVVLRKIVELMPKEPPALVHGDLWSGNLLVEGHGQPCLIDPAVYYGHREMDIAFSQLFGGFGQRFYETYQEVYPMEPGFDSRIDLYNLYPLLVHLNLFGRSYLGQIEHIIGRFT
jgi:protein-ribulosamine 3-kinase